MTITEIPTSEEYRASALNYLHMAWEIGMELWRELDNAGYYADLDQETQDEYWIKSQPALGNAFALLQQAHEFELKSRIAAVSPFLLISREPRDWPKHSDKQDTTFSAFRTLDAADLVKLNNTVAPTKIPEETAHFLDEVRRLRNTTVHFGISGQQFDVSRLFAAVLRTYQEVFNLTDWAGERRNFKSEDRLAVAFTDEHVGEMILNEFEAAVEVLTPAETKKYFGFDKKARRYLCPPCQSGIQGDYVALAQLSPNSPASTKIRCFVCGTETKVVRKKCGKEACKSNVIEEEDDVCLVCYS